MHQITGAMREHFPAIVATSNEHVWTITPSLIVFSAHLSVDPGQLDIDDMNGWLEDVEHWLEERFDIAESTLQVHPANGETIEADAE